MATMHKPAILLTCLFALATQAQETHKWAVVLHGGAGVIERSHMDPQTEAAYRADLQTAIQKAADVLDKGGSALDAIEAAIRYMEDDPLFNAGRGAVFSAAGKNDGVIERPNPPYPYKSVGRAPSSAVLPLPVLYTS